MKQNLKCPKCISQKVNRDGKRKTQNRGLIQRFRCKECSYRFVEDDGFKGMRNSPQKITLCLDLFYRGISTRKVQEHLQAFYPHNSSHKTIYKWVIKYSKKISKFTNNLKLNVGNEIQIDEMEYHRRKHHNKKGVDKNWFIDVVDCKTRFMVASDYTKSRGVKSLSNVLRNAKKKTENQVNIVTSDGLNAYPRVLKKTFGLNKLKAKTKIKHNRVIASKGDGFNYPIERLHNNLRQRTKTFRGFHGSISSANALMKGLEIYYNFITKHQGINKVPYELATDLKLNSNNKWLELIELSSK